MIEIRHVSKNFRDLEVLKEISFSLSPGEIYGLIGYNGVGKTTLLKICSGIYRSDAGGVFINNTPVYESPECKRQCFFMTEEPPFFDQTSLQQMRVFYKGMIPDWSDGVFQKLIDYFELNPAKKVSRFSKGMQRQASLCAAFASRARYLFLDEAFDGLDYTIRRQVSDLLRWYAKEQKACVIISSHNLRELEGLADTIGMLSNGELVFNGSVGEIQKNYTVCICRFPRELPADGMLNPVLSESLPDNSHFFLLHETQEDTGRIFYEAGAKILQIRPAQLEEYFRIERHEKKGNWDEIFA